MPLTLDRERFISMMKAQAAIGGTQEGGLDRVALSAADGEVRDWFHDVMIDAGLSVRVDEVGNIFGRREGADPTAPPVILGSHLDSQPNGGIYDGTLGVVAALELVMSLKEQNIETKRPIEIVNWTNEEGTRFQPASDSSGSRVWAGQTSVESAYNASDQRGTTFEDALTEIGYKGDVPATPNEEYDSYLELHIEQGPRLSAAEKDVGVVTGVVSRSWGAITFKGTPDHSGTTPVKQRNDAMVAVANVVLATRRIAESIGEHTVGTNGVVDVKPNSINVVPGEATVTWGFRDPSNEIVDDARKKLLSEAAMAAEREGLDWDYEDHKRDLRTEFSSRCIEAVQSAADERGYDNMRLVSAAGHDAPHLTEVCDVGMIFAVSENGKSHSPEEFTTWDHCLAGANTLAGAAMRLAGGPVDDVRC